MTVDSAAAPAGSFPRTVAVVGLGLIGGSLALGLRAAGARVLGVDIDQAAVALARQRGAVDAGSTDLDAVAGADLVIVATPLAQVAAVSIAAAGQMRRGAVLTDTGSVKAAVVAAIHAGLPPGIRYVGGHPMAGSERQGMAAADSALLEGRPFVITPTPRTDPGAVAVVQEAVERIGMRPVVMDPIDHDEMVAQVSHLPYLVSVALMRSAAEEAREIGGPALAEMTRVAHSPQLMWQEICRANREAILRALARFEAELARLRRDVEEGAPR